jgi:signal transduction histidine kinase
MRAAEAERDAVRVVASALAGIPAERRPAAVADLSRGFPGRLLLVGPGIQPVAVETSGGVLRPPWRVPREGLAEVRGGGDATVLVVGAPMSGGGAGAGVVAVLAPGHRDRAERTPWFAAAFAVVAFGLSMLPVVVVGQRFSADLRRVAVGMSRMVEVEAEAAGAGKPPPRRVPEASDELGLLAWSYELTRDRFASELRRYGRSHAQLVRADQDKIDFLAVMSHELRTPLNTIIGFSEVLLEGLEGPLSPGQHEDLRIIRESGDHLLSLVNDILELSAFHAGQVHADFVEVDAVEIARAVMDEAEGQLRGKPVRLALRLESEHLRLRGDARLLRRVLQNLVGNALKFTQRGEVRLDVHRDGDQAVLAVSDTGPGIEPKALATVFEEYRQTGDARTRREGTGLGLAIVRRLAQLHGGDVSASSVVGQGSIFTVRVPIGGPSGEGDHA